MSRTKKTRKGVSSPSMRLSKDKLKEQRALKDLKGKKQKGNKAGSRNDVDSLTVTETHVPKVKKDKAIGSKKPVSLVPQEKIVEPKAEIKRNLKPKAELVKVVEPELLPEQELEQLESDQRLLALIERHEAGELLSGKDAKYFNAKIARHQALCDILGLDDEDEIEHDVSADDTFDQFVSDDLASEWLDEDEK